MEDEGSALPRKRGEQPLGTVGRNKRSEHPPKSSTTKAIKLNEDDGADNTAQGRSQSDVQDDVDGPSVEGTSRRSNRQRHQENIALKDTSEPCPQGQQSNPNTGRKKAL